MGRYFNFNSIQLVRIGVGQARIVDVGRKLRYLDFNGAEVAIDLEDCARIAAALRSAGKFPPGNDTDWAALAAPDRGVTMLHPHGLIGLRAVLDEPPWFQFLDRRRTQFEFKDEDAIRNDLLAPLAAAGWQTWDAS